MNKLGKLLAWTLVSLVVILALGITFTIGWRPFIGPKTRPLSSRKFESSPARLARGEYLVNNVTDCMDCHSQHNWTAHDAPILPNTLGAGQDMTMLKGLPGKIYAPNITPDPETGAGNWSDDQLARAIREGVGHDGRALFPFMPYPDFKSMSDEDLASVIIYLRSLPPVHQQQPQTDLIFPVKYLIRSAPRPLENPVPEPDLSTPEKRGKYLVTIADAPIAIRHRTHTASRFRAWNLLAASFSTALGAKWPAPISLPIRPDLPPSTRPVSRK
ncbi:MAG TPA: c-type cytochrome [Candidatus Acidoferrales bacterium]|nr:c-type cytochrome [Candidatus Acidoferrales bacterium]